MAAVNSMAEAFGQAATHAPQPMQAAASMAVSASGLGTGMALASGAPPVLAVTKPPASMMRSKALRSTTRSLITGKAWARHGSMKMVSPSLKWRMCSWHTVVARCGPWAMPLIISPHMPQMPSRQSWSKAMGRSPLMMSRSLTTSSISRNDMSVLMPGASYLTILPARAGTGLPPDVQRQVDDLLAVVRGSAAPGWCR